MGGTPEEQATYDAFFGDTGGPIFQADLVDKAISNDAPNFHGMIRVDGSQISIASTIFLATEQRHRAHNEDVERRIWQPVPDKPMTGIISQMVAAHESHEPYEALKVKEGMYKEFAKGYKPMHWDNVSVMLSGVEIANMNKENRPINNPYEGKINPIELSLSETTEGEDMKMKGEWTSALSAGNKPIELEDIMHIRGSVPHFMGNPVPTWEGVDRIEKECRSLSAALGISFDRACSIAADLFAKAAPGKYSPNKIKVVLKELANQVQFAKEKTTFNCRISARQARRSAQGVKFAKQLKNNFNVKKGK